MHTILWSYKGYSGDEYFMNVSEKLAAKFAPSSRTVGLRLFSWLNQRGFGPGYYNNSGVYIALRKSVFKSEAERDAALALMKQPFMAYAINVYETEAEYNEMVAASRRNQKDMRKLNPY